MDLMHLIQNVKATDMQWGRITTSDEGFWAPGSYQGSEDCKVHCSRHRCKGYLGQALCLISMTAHKDADEAHMHHVVMGC